MFVNNDYQDKYYGHLLDFFSKKEKESIYFLPHIVEIEELSFFKKNSKSNGLNVIFKHDYLKISDYFFSLIMPLRLKFDKNIHFNQFNIDDLLRKDFKRNLFNTSSFFGLLNFRFVMRLKDRFPENINLFINWFENQLIDRGLNKGFNLFFDNLETKGYQGFIVSLDYNTYLCPTKIEDQLGVLPKEIHVCGKGLKKSLGRFNADLVIKTSPAFRFSHLWKKEDDFTLDFKYKNKVLVILPFLYSESIKIINKIFDIIDDKRLTNVKYSLKLHPDLNEDKLLSLVKHIPKNVKFEQRDIHDSLKDHSLIIGNNSSACNESIALGIPVIIIGDRVGISQNPIPPFTDKLLWRIVFGKEELLSAIIFYNSISNYDRQEMYKASKLIKENYFEQLSQSSVREFLNFNPN